MNKRVNSIKVLLVENNPAEARFLQKLLATVDGENFELVVVEQMKDAVKWLKQNHFEVVLLDLDLPNSQGVNIVQHIHTICPSVAIVVITGWDNEEIALKALRQGAQEYIVKGEIHKSLLVRALHSAIQRQQEFERLQDFAYVVCHDLQQPIQTIIGFAKILDDKYESQINGEAREYLKLIVEGGLRMSDLIRNLLAYSRMGTPPQVDEPTDCNKVLKIVLTNLHEIIRETCAEITYEPLPKIMIHQSQLIQLFQNLISNGIKYRRPEEPPRISISVQQRGLEWLFGVHDNGMGIDPKDQERVFKMFERLQGHNDWSGTGIGLAICKKIVELHGGRIWVESQPGCGCDFYLTLKNQVAEKLGETGFFLTVSV